MSVSMKIKGDKRLQRRLKRYADRAPLIVDQLLTKAAFHVQNVAITSIQQSPSTGRQYRRGSTFHTASSPGEAPATDTGNLVRNITVEKKAVMHYDVGSRKNAPYGFWLEFGTSKMDARPWLTPAVNQGRKKLKTELRKLKA